MRRTVPSIGMVLPVVSKKTGCHSKRSPPSLARQRGVKEALTSQWVRDYGLIMKLSLKRELRCSFCRKSESAVAKLIGGRRVHICDACVGLCNRILEATPPTFAGWEAMTDAQLL